MPESSTPSEVDVLEQRVASLTEKLSDAKRALQTWTDAGSSLAQSAAEARANNQGAGRGFFGAVFGSKYRGVVRRAAAASNAAIAQQVVEKRSKIAEGKREAKELIHRIKEELSATKTELKETKTELKEKARGEKANSRSRVAAVESAASTLSLLHKLKEARDAGLLSESEFEEKRRKLVSDI